MLGIYFYLDLINFVKNINDEKNSIYSITCRNIYNEL
ncbi:MAG: hypothetical protein RJA25_2270 [Bacteroidota bacterium]|mgnify:CR=1 FL=1|jgi:hypothetical protein